MDFCKYRSLGCYACIDTVLLSAHYQKCKYTTCSNKYNNQDCEKIGTRENIKQHMNNSCNYRLVSCKGKGKCQIPFCNLDTHDCRDYIFYKLLKLFRTNNEKTMKISYNSIIKLLRHKGQKDATETEMLTITKLCKDDEIKMNQLELIYSFL